MDATLEDAGVVNPEDTGERAGGEVDRRFSHVTNRGHSSNGDRLSCEISSTFPYCLDDPRSIFSSNTSKQW